MISLSTGLFFDCMSPTTRQLPPSIRRAMFENRQTPPGCHFFHSSDNRFCRTNFLSQHAHAALAEQKSTAFTLLEAPGINDSVFIRLPLNSKPHFRISARLAWSAFIAWAILICFLPSLTPDDLRIVPSRLLAMDKLVHAIAYSVGGTCLAFALGKTIRVRSLWLFLAIVVGIGLFGATDELHQPFTPGRSGADFYDWLADMVGGSVAAFVYCQFHGHTRVASNSAGSASEDPAAS